MGRTRVHLGPQRGVFRWVAVDSRSEQRWSPSYCCRSSGRLVAAARRHPRSTRPRGTRPSRSPKSWPFATALTPEAKKAPSRNRAKSKTTKSIAQLESAEKLQTKAKNAPAEKKGRVQTLDDLLDEFEGKLSLIKGVSRLDACRQASDAISRDSSLSASEQKNLSEKLKELGDTSS